LEEVEEELSKLKNKFDWDLYEYNYYHSYINYSYLFENTNRFLENNQKHILKLKKMLKEQKESKQFQLEEK
jgi:hypothetical protein